MFDCLNYWGVLLFFDGSETYRIFDYWFILLLKEAFLLFALVFKFNPVLLIIMLDFIILFAEFDCIWSEAGIFIGTPVLCIEKLLCGGKLLI
jgi:hypothetical protein